MGSNKQTEARRSSSVTEYIKEKDQKVNSLFVKLGLRPDRPSVRSPSVDYYPGQVHMGF